MIEHRIGWDKNNTNCKTFGLNFNTFNKLHKPLMSGKSIMNGLQRIDMVARGKNDRY